VLPYADRAEAESILKDFVLDFQAYGIPELCAGDRRPTAADGSVEITVLAGIAQGQPNEDMDSILDAAKNQEKEIARLRCDGGR
jgi:hypothetical protein